MGNVFFPPFVFLLCAGCCVQRGGSILWRDLVERAPGPHEARRSFAVSIPQGEDATLGFWCGCHQMGISNAILQR